MARLSRFLSILLVLLFLSAPLAASGSRGAHPAAKPKSSFAWLWAGLSRLVGLTSTMPKSEPPSLPSGDNGSTMDPNGGK